MRIGIDIDGCLTEIDKWMLKTGKMEGYKVISYEYEPKDTFGLTSEEEHNYWLKYFDKLMTNVEMRPNASKVISNLRRKGHEIYIITARVDEDIPRELSNVYNIEDLTLEWLKRHNITYDHLEMRCLDKDVYCKNNKIDIMIDDSPSNITKVSKLIPVICMDCSYNYHMKGRNIVHVKNWDDIDSIIL